MIRAAFCLFVLPALASAQTLHAETPGDGLAVNSPCATSVTVTVDPGLSGRAVLDATAAHPEELAQLVFTTEKNTATLRTHDDECWREGDPDDHDRTLQVTLRIPPRFAVSVEDSGSPAYRIGDLQAPLSVDGSGHMTLSAGEVPALNLSLSGSGHVTIRRATEAIHADMSGSAEVDIGGGAIAALDIEASGSGTFHFGSGTITALHVESSGSAEIGVGATVATASVDLSGSGNVRIARVTGPMAKEAEGSGQVIVGSE